MATTFCYIPFPEQSLNDNAVTSGQVNIIYSNLTIFDDAGRYIGGSAGKFIKRRFFANLKPLSVVGQDDILIISAHGLGGAGNPANPNLVAAKIHVPNGADTTAGIEVEWLAQRIKKDGLTTSIKTIQLSICYSGLAGGTVFNPGTKIVNPEDDASSASLASLLAIELGKLGYDKLLVSGATGEVSGNKVSLGFFEGCPQNVSFESGSRQFDTKGNRIADVNTPTRARGQTRWQKDV
ncbi:MAG: hypothetical protein H7232_02105 [Aeromicrobium sp.]|nr:hypothetical protein [Burkholderiales bacterium]